jgi:hypothetical protein
VSHRTLLIPSYMRAVMLQQFGQKQNTLAALTTAVTVFLNICRASQLTHNMYSYGSCWFQLCGIVNLKWLFLIFWCCCCCSLVVITQRSVVAANGEICVWFSGGRHMLWPYDAPCLSQKHLLLSITICRFQCRNPLTAKNDVAFQSNRWIWWERTLLHFCKF